MNRSPTPVSRVRIRGFTLLEVLVAMTILALVLGGVYEVLGQGTRAIGIGEGFYRASIHAESLLTRVGEDLPLESATGQFDDGYSWRIEVEPIADGAGARLGGATSGRENAAQSDEETLTYSLILPFRVSAEVSWPDANKTRSVKLYTVRVKAAQGGRS